MKQIKWLALATFITVFIFGCNKNNNDTLQLTPATTQEVTVQKGVVTFPTIQSYLTVTENNSNQQQMLSKNLSVANFSALKNKSTNIVANNNSNSVVPTITTSAFNPALYSDYLLSILNADKICSINGFYVKVDMDNNFCSAIDAALPNAYADLNSNSFSNNANIMTFLHTDEPVLEVLGKIRNNEMTWDQYQIELSNAKGGQGICFKTGLNNQQADVSKLVGNFLVRATVHYAKYFIHFELVGSARSTDANGNYVATRLDGKYDWAGACKNGGIGTYSINYPYQNPASAALHIKIIYSGGSALKRTKLEAKSSCLVAGGLFVVASIGY